MAGRGSIQTAGDCSKLIAGADST
ncbi:hypothetical protein ACQEPW_002445 [Xanthomonas oryzae pv. oryzicola]